MHTHFRNTLWQFHLFAEERTLFKEAKDSNDNMRELLEVAERTDGSMNADDAVDALRSRAALLTQRLEKAKSEKLGLWQQVSRFTLGVISKERRKGAVQRRKIDEHINQEVTRRIQAAETEASESIRKSVNKAEMRIISAKIKQKVIEEVTTYLKEDEARLRSIEQSLTDWASLLEDGRAISPEDLQASADINELKSRLNISGDLQQIAGKTKEAAREADPKAFSWGKSAERMIRNQLIEIGLSAQEINDYLRQHMSGSSNLIHIVQERLQDHPKFRGMLISALERLRSESVRGYRLFSQLTEQNPNMGTIDDRLQRLEREGYPGYAVDVAAGSTTIHTIFRTAYRDPKTRKSYAILQDSLDSSRFVVIDIAKKEVALRNTDDNIERYMLDGELNTITLQPSTHSS